MVTGVTRDAPRADVAPIDGGNGRVWAAEPAQRAGAYVDRGACVESRTIKCGTTRATLPSAASPETAPVGRSFDAARRAMSRIGSRIVVSAGDSRDATGLSSNPTTDNSSGIT